MDTMLITVTKTAVLELDPLEARVLAARICSALGESDTAMDFSFHYQEDTLSGVYELSGDEDRVNELLALLAEPCTEEETAAFVKAEQAERKRDKLHSALDRLKANRDRILMTLIGIGALTVSALLLLEADDL